jgi:hypothetical protein
VTRNHNPCSTNITNRIPTVTISLIFLDQMERSHNIESNVLCAFLANSMEFHRTFPIEKTRLSSPHSNSVLISDNRRNPVKVTSNPVDNIQSNSTVLQELVLHGFAYKGNSRTVLCNLNHLIRALTHLALNGCLNNVEFTINSKTITSATNKTTAATSTTGNG